MDHRPNYARTRRRSQRGNGSRPAGNWIIAPVASVPSNRGRTPGPRPPRQEERGPISLSTACSPPEEESEASSSSAATATSAADLGGLDALVAEAKKEGALNVIALPPDWADYGEIIKAFGDEYGIKVNSAQPDGSSQAEINAATQLKGQVPAPANVADLLKPEYKGKVALNGDPTQAGIESGQTPVVFDRDYLNAAQSKNTPNWKVFLPSDAVLGSYYAQAINKDAPHPAAARLWQEFLYSDEGQNLWLQGGARPVRADAMQKAGTIDAAAFAALPAVAGTPVIPTEAQNTTAKGYLTANWAKAIG
ncbi:extracellular solute-binding protein [Actinoplanes sp. NPDC023714]|uniref:ABC transporter substrate-binding protein n=1 Tax=Actinoplanes sp. NPDC023714 TaxID=3154322 RepID=UPI0033EAF2CE